MVLVSIYEDAVTPSVRRLDFVSYIADVGLHVQSDESYFAESPDGIAALDQTKLLEALACNAEKIFFDNGLKLALASSEIKTLVSVSSLNDVLHREYGSTHI